MFDITIKQQSSGLILDRVTFSIESHWRAVLHEITERHGLRRKSHTPTEERWTNGSVLVIGRRDTRTPTQRIIDVAEKAIGGGV
ncbi:MAG: hypothetical protein ABFD81_18100 [Syntrophaceae bacterium]